MSSLRDVTTWKSWSLAFVRTPRTIHHACFLSRLRPCNHHPLFSGTEEMNFGHESLLQRRRMTGTVAFMIEGHCPSCGTDVRLPSGNTILSIADLNGVYGISYLHEKHLSECSAVTYGPVQYVFLNEQGAFGTYVVPIVASGQLQVVVKDFEPVTIEVLIFRQGDQPCVHMIFDPRPHNAAKVSRIAAVVEAATEPESTGSVHREIAAPGEKDGATPSGGEGGAAAGPMGKSKKKSVKKSAISPELANLILSSPCNLTPDHTKTWASAAVTVSRVYRSTCHSHNASRVEINARLSPTLCFWLEEVSATCPHACPDSSQSVRASFASPSHAWNTVRLLTKDNRFNPGVELCSTEKQTANPTSAKQVWSVILLADHSMATSV